MLVVVKDTACLDFQTQLEESRAEILELAERVKKLVAKRSEREAMVQQFRQATGSPRPLQPKLIWNFCSSCATNHTHETFERVRGCGPATLCDTCRQPAIISIQFKKFPYTRMPAQI
jgi:hypothetical protein